MPEPEKTDVLFPPVTWTQTCYACQFAMFGSTGTYCPVFQEPILSEKLSGQDCPEFQSNDGKSYVRLAL